MTMTKKQALEWRSKVEKGERPLVPKEVVYLMGMPTEEIIRDIDHAKRFDYGNRLETDAKRLVLMGLLDEKYYWTDLGKDYWDRGDERKPQL